MERCIDCGGTIPASDVPNASHAWILGKGAGLTCAACDERELAEYYAQFEPEEA